MLVFSCFRNVINGLKQLKELMYKYKLQEKFVDKNAKERKMNVLYPVHERRRLNF